MYNPFLFCNHGKIVIGVNDPKPTEKPAPGMEWLRMKGGPQEGEWVQVEKRHCE